MHKHKPKSKLTQVTKRHSKQQRGYSISFRLSKKKCESYEKLNFLKPQVCLKILITIKKNYVSSKNELFTPGKL